MYGFPSALGANVHGIEYPTVDWSSVPFYVVGKATASVLAEIRDLYGYSHLVPKDIRGESSGTSENLARIILADMERKPAKLLYLTGDKNRDTLPKILKEGDVELELLKVYETQGSSNFARELEEAVNLASKGAYINFILRSSSDIGNLQNLSGGGSFSLHLLLQSL